jgi:hypothetical protein
MVYLGKLGEVVVAVVPQVRLREDWEQQGKVIMVQLVIQLVHFMVVVAAAQVVVGLL